MSQELTENGSHPTPEEIHRLKQRYIDIILFSPSRTNYVFYQSNDFLAFRNQYQLMLAGLDQLSEVLPPTVGADKVKSKVRLEITAFRYELAKCVTAPRIIV